MSLSLGLQYFGALAILTGFWARRTRRWRLSLSAVFLGSVALTVAAAFVAWWGVAWVAGVAALQSFRALGSSLRGPG